MILDIGAGPVLLDAQAEATGNVYRYISTLGPRYSLPMYFTDRDRGIAHAERAKKWIGDLPGQDTMQIEELGPEGDWTPIWPKEDQ